MVSQMMYRQEINEEEMTPKMMNRVKMMLTYWRMTTMGIWIMMTTLMRSQQSHWSKCDTKNIQENELKS